MAARLRAGRRGRGDAAATAGADALTGPGPVGPDTAYVRGLHDVRTYDLATGGGSVTCTVPAGQCTGVEGTEGQVVHLPDGTLDSSSIALPDGSSAPPHLRVCVSR